MENDVGAQEENKNDSQLVAPVSSSISLQARFAKFRKAKAEELKFNKGVVNVKPRSEA